jgi:hypothetical protein
MRPSERRSPRASCAGCAGCAGWGSVGNRSRSARLRIRGFRPHFKLVLGDARRRHTKALPTAVERRASRRQRRGLMGAANGPVWPGCLPDRLVRPSYAADTHRREECRFGAQFRAYERGGGPSSRAYERTAAGASAQTAKPRCAYAPSRKRSIAWIAASLGANSVRMMLTASRSMSSSRAISCSRSDSAEVIVSSAAPMR